MEDVNLLIRRVFNEIERLKNAEHCSEDVALNAFNSFYYFCMIIKRQDLIISDFLKKYEGKQYG